MNNNATRRKRVRSNSTKPQRNRGTAQSRNNNNMVRLVTQPSFNGELVKTFTIPGPTQIVTTSLGGSVASVYAIGNVTSQVIDWTDFTAFYDQYLIVSVRFKIICQTPPTPGTMKWFFDGSAAAGVPVVADEGRNGVLTTNHSMNANRIWVMDFKVKDFTLMSYRNTAVDYVVGYFKYITNTANFGTTAASTALYQYQAFYTVACRGKKS